MSEQPADYTHDQVSVVLGGEDLPDDDLGDIWAQLGLDDQSVDAYRVKVYRIDKDDMKWVFDMRPDDDFPVLDRLRDEYDGGKFEVRVYKHNKIHRRQRLSVEAPKKKPVPETLSAADVMAMMQRQQEQNLAQIRELIAHRPEPAAAVDAAAVQRETIAMMVSLKELFAQPTPAREPRVDLLGQVRDVLELRRELQADQPDANGELLPTLAGMLKDLMPMLAPAQPNPRARPRLSAPAGKPQNRPTPPAYQPQPPPGASETAAAAANPAPPRTSHPQPPQPEPPMNELEKILSQLCMMATLRTSAADSATMLYNGATDEQYDVLAELVEAEDCVDRLVAVYAPVAPHRAWFESLRTELLALLADDEEGIEDDEPTAERDAGLPANDDRPISGDRESETDNAPIKAELKVEHAAKHARAGAHDTGENPVR